jgi:glycosyltransferase involved in cell wall biosynthesis
MRQTAYPTRPRRILHVIFSRRLAGAERYCSDLANRQAEQGDEVHVLSRPGAMIEMALRPEVIFHALRVPIFRAAQLRRLAHRLRIDVAHAHLSPACKALAQAPESIGRIATLHVGYKPHQHAKLDGLICVNQAQLAQLSGYQGMSRVISNWIPAACAAGKPPRLRANLAIAPEAYVVGAVGRLDASKGMDLLIQAFRATAPADAALVILGEGRQRAELEKLRAGDARIHLAGFHEDVQGALQEFDLFVSPSREETFGLAILEAMNAGLPVLASAAEGPREILRSQPAQLVAAGSLFDLSAGLAAEFAKRRAVSPTVDKARVAYDLAPFDPALSLAHIADFYDHVLHRSSRREPLPALLGDWKHV